jgi:hypothetical protein
MHMRALANIGHAVAELMQALSCLLLLRLEDNQCGCVTAGFHGGDALCCTMRPHVLWWLPV